MPTNPKKDITDKRLDELLHALSANPDAQSDSRARPGSAARILAALPISAAQPTPRAQAQSHWLADLLDNWLGWLDSPMRAAAAGVVPLLLGLLLGTTTPDQATEMFLSSESYPPEDELLVLAGLTDDFTSELSMGFETTATTLINPLIAPSNGSQ